MWLKRLLAELECESGQGFDLLSDSQSAISIAKNPVQHDRTKHVEIDRHFIYEKVNSGAAKLHYVPTKHQLADALTKALPRTVFKEFTFKLVCLNEEKVPTSIDEALKDSKWRRAVEEEINALEKNDTWTVMDLPQGKKVVGCKWVFVVIFNSDGSIQRHKARVVAKGYTQTYGIDYNKTFAPMATLNTVQVLLSLAFNCDWKLHQLDFKNAFLNGKPEEEVYIFG
ncbi:hypothetical protein GQ457_07G016830 [Hibiscus cannabinus]